jgi:hypothetical protein
MTQTVYVCYQFRERALADELAGALDVTNLPLDDYDQRMRAQVASDVAGEIKSRLADAIAQAGTVIALVGPTTATSSWVNWELEAAREAGKPLLIARLGPDDAIPTGAGTQGHVVSGDLAEIVAAVDEVKPR